MTNISKFHKRFSERLNRPEVLTNPEEFLGPNFEAVLNYWLILDGLSRDQLKTIEGRYWDFSNNRNKAADEAIEASDKTIGEEFADNAAWAACDVYGYGAAYYATSELIGMHLLLDQQKPLTFLPMFLEVL